MEYKANYTLVGLFVLLLGAGLVAIALWLSAGFEKKNYNIYEVFMNEPVSGLSQQAPVKFNGVAVGTVRSIRLNKLNPKQVSLLLNIAEGTPITTSTVATLLSQGITGVTYIGLRATKAISHPLQKKPGQPYPVIPSEPSLLMQLDKTVHEVTEDFNTVAAAFDRTFTHQNAELLTQILTNLQRVTKTFANNHQNLDTTLHNFAIISQRTATASKKLPALIGSANDAMQNIDTEVVPPVISVIQKLNTIAANLEELSNELQRDPSVILRGKTATPLGPGERE